MDENSEKDWKSKMGFPINYDSGQSTDDDFDTKDVVMRHSSSRVLLADEGDGSEADLLGSTPPRSRIRDKEKRRNFIDSGASLQRMIREKKDAIEHAAHPDSTPVSERLRKRSSLKVIRSRERDLKLDMGQQNKADSLPSPNPVAPPVPTLVESCSRFMSLTSKPKCREQATETQIEERWPQERDEELPANRANFHKTFSMLINMGNIDKTCRRTGQISREEQVWQNSLKDMIWLELQARVAGRSLAAQDAWLCAQRHQVHNVLRNISEYRFVNKSPCRRQAKRAGDMQSREDLTDKQINDSDVDYGCLQLDCQTCADAVGRCMREVGTLLDAFYNAVSLYPSSKAMTADLPLVATNLFKNRLKAMCLWFNTALSMRLKMLAVQRILRSMKLKSQRELRQRSSVDSDVSRKSSESHRNCTVRFNISNDPTPTGSSNSDSSYAKDDDIKETAQDNTQVTGSEDKATNSDENVTNSEVNESENKAEKGDDEVDSSGDLSRIGPEIVVDSRYSTVESSDTGYQSDASAPPYDAYDVGPLSDLTQLVVLNKTKVSIYREHHQEILKTQGVRRCMTFVNKMRKNILYKVFLTLEKPDTEHTHVMEEGSTEVFHDPKEEDVTPDKEVESGLDELKRYGCWSEECMSMRLPSYRSHFLLLCSISMEVVHDYLSLRLEIKPDRPSCLTIKQLMQELRDGLDIATEMRADFVRNVQVALVGRSAGAGAAAHDLLLLINTFDNTVETMLQLYLSYLTMMSAKEPLRRSMLQSEWAFIARLARRLRAAHRLAPVTFAKIACNQLDRLFALFNEKFESIAKRRTNKDGERDNTDPEKQLVYSACRTAQYIFAREREHTLHAAQWARALAARLAKAPPPAYINERQDIFNSLMAIRDFIVGQVQFILKQSASRAWEASDPVVTRVRELLLQICKLGFEVHRELYMFAQAPPPWGRGLRARPASLPPRAPALPAAARPRPETILVHESFNPVLGESAVHKELHRIVNETGSRRAVVSPPRQARGKFMRLDSVLDDNENDDTMQQYADGRAQTSIEVLLSGSPPPEAGESGEAEGGEAVELRAREEAPRVSEEEKQWACRVARAVVQFATCWMTFVMERCDRGRGLRPRWASQGLEFLMLACDPCNTRHLSEQEFEELKKLMDGCISHVIGSRPTPDASLASPASLASLASPTPPRPRHRLHSPFSSSSGGKEIPTPPTPPPTDLDPVMCFTGPEISGHSRRVLSAIQEVEESRERQLREAGRVGRVVTSTVSEYEPKLRQVTFKWQRGLKIGAGSFGKVYTIVNTESGQLLAMKELSVGADRRASQRAANELRVLEGVIHPHLVRYYGCELHREEMLIFMELCVEGSLEALVATSGALGEGTVRRYSKQLLSAVAALHARSIAHRDIKSGNIFLTNEGHCLKLGDFGCAVKIRANTTAPNELQGFVGTQAYMAPEVFMKSSGHGRAADIWSVGCVVTEMASGKRPFSEYDSNYQIMFMVGMGSRPGVPPALSEEGRQFCELCLTHDPALRPRADNLMMHTFLMVKADEDCNCEAGFLATNTS